MNAYIIREILYHFPAFRLSVLEELKSNRQNTVDLKIELRQGLHDIKMEVSKVCTAIRESVPPAGAAGSQGDQRAEIAIHTLNKDLNQVLSSLPRQIANAMPVPPPPQVIHQQAPTPAPAQASSGLSLTEMQVWVAK